MTDQLEAGKVRFWMEHGTEVATLSAHDFRAAMSERDHLRAEVERLQDSLKLILDVAPQTSRIRSVAQQALDLNLGSSNCP